MTRASDAVARKFGRSFLRSWSGCIPRGSTRPAVIRSSRCSRAAFEHVNPWSTCPTALPRPWRALDDLLDSAQQVTRSLLGVGNDPEDL